MKKLFTLSLLALMCLGTFAQSVTLSFTGRDAKNQNIKLDRVVITNQTQNWQETINYPDTILMLGCTGIEDVENANAFKLSQNAPNPFNGTTDFALQMPQTGKVSLTIYDINGKRIAAYQGKLALGIHTFRVLLNTTQSYMLTARCGSETATIKMVNTGRAGENAIRYQGNGSPLTTLLKGSTDKPFALGDNMTYVGFSTIDGEECESQTIEKQLASETIILNFITNEEPTDGEPCKGGATVKDYDNNTYNTVKIGDQCWMKENLKTTKYADGTNIEQGSSISDSVGYWYYPNNNSSNKDTYGLLYNWKAVMNNSSSSNTNPSNVQGICPTGWHVPSDAEWTQLTDYVSSQSQYVCDTAHTKYIAKALASTTGWRSFSGPCCIGDTPSSNNATGFSAVPTGYYYEDYYYFGDYTYFWSATALGTSRAWYRILYCNNAYVDRNINNRLNGFAVRCLRD